MTTTTQAGVYTKRVPPSTEMLVAMINDDHMTLRIAVKELIANAIEQAATEIELGLDRASDLFWIRDNGCGCPDLAQMTVFGKHYHTNDLQRISRYGVGLKDATVWMGAYLFVHSMYVDGKKEWMHADWNKIIMGDWDFEYKNDSDCTSHGVTLKVQALRPNRFRWWSKVGEWIGEDFALAIKAGATIRVDGVEVEANPDPELIDQIPFSGTYGGLKFEGFCGILKDRKNFQSGWDICYGPLAIARGYQKEGFGKYSPQGFYGRLNLIDGDRKKWTLTRNKTGADELEDILNCDWMQAIIKPILEKLKSYHRTVTFRLNQANVQLTLANMLHRCKVKLSDTETEEGGKREPRGGKRPPRERRPGQGATRKKRLEDQSSKIKERINRALSLRVDPHQEPKARGLGYVEVVEGGKEVRIYIDETTQVGQTIFNNHQLLLHHAVGLLAQYFTFGDNGVDWINRQMLLFANETDDCKKHSKVLLFLLQNAIELQPQN